jgi:putative transposase
MIDTLRGRFGVEPICRVLEVPTSTDYAHKQHQPSTRTQRDAQLKVEITRIWTENFEVDGARKLWRQLQREGIGVARCTVERLMVSLACRVWCAASPSAPRWAIRRPSGPPTLVDRQFTAEAPNQLGVADLTYVRTWSGFCYAGFIIDASSRLLVGWRLASHLRTDLALDALELASWRRQAQLDGLVHHSDRAANTCRSAPPNASPTPGRSPRSAPAVTGSIMPWPRARSGCPRPS